MRRPSSCRPFSGWRLDLTIIGTGLLVIVYTVTGGSAAVSLTQKWQMLVIFGGMVAAFFIVLARLPAGLGFGGAAHLAGALGKLEAVDFSFDPGRRYTFWSGLFGGLFLSLSYFGTDQSQVQRYIGGASLREGRLGLMFNALLKIPMQFFILLLGALVFIFYQFQPAPIFYNRAEWAAHANGPHGAVFRALEDKHAALHVVKQRKIAVWQEARARGDTAVEQRARAELRAAQKATDDVRGEARAALLAVDPHAKTKDSDYVFIGFIVAQLPHGLVGSARRRDDRGRARLESLRAQRARRHEHHRPVASCRPLAAGHDEARNVRAAKWFTAGWGLFAIGFALFAGFAENLIEAINILGSLFYGVVLGLFLTAFFLKRVAARPSSGAPSWRSSLSSSSTPRSASPTFGTTSSAASPA
ncbi:MAG: hypothetical protein WDM96_14130 [Lacunisphaera sp.]